MQERNIVFEMKGERIGLLTVNRPAVMNALNNQTLQELNALFDEIAKDPMIRGLIITGAGKSFVAGADLAEIQDDKIEENRAYAQLAQSVFNKLEALPIPTIAAVNGFALGGGCELSLCCDIRIAGEKAKFGQPEVKLGVMPCFGGTQRLPKLIGTGWAKELIYTGRMINAVEAQQIGLVTKVVPMESLLDTAIDLMQEIIVNSSTAIKYSKLAIDKGRDMHLIDGLEFEKDLSAICYGLPDKEEGVKAFLEKRRPVF